MGARNGTNSDPTHVRYSFLLPLDGVPDLSVLLGWEPTGLIVATPDYDLYEAHGEVGVSQLPAELGPEVDRVDRVTAVVVGAIAHPVEVVLQVGKALQDLAEHDDADQLAVDADQVDPHPNLGEDA